MARRRTYFEARAIIDAQLARIHEDLCAGRIDGSTTVTLSLPADVLATLRTCLESGDYSRDRLQWIEAALREIAPKNRNAAALLRNAGLIPSTEEDRERRADWIARTYTDLAGDGPRVLQAPGEAIAIAMPLWQRFPEQRREIAIYSLAKYLHEDPEKLQRALYDSKQIRGRAREAREEFIREHLDLWRELHGERDEEADRKSAEALPDCPPLLSVPESIPFDKFLGHVRKTMPMWEGGTDGLRDAAIRCFAKYLGITPSTVNGLLADYRRIFDLPAESERDRFQRRRINEHVMIWRRIHGEMPDELEGGGEEPAPWNDWLSLGTFVDTFRLWKEGAYNVEES